MSTHTNGRIRAVVTGIGALSALGNSADELWSGLKAGRSGIAPLTQVETENYPCKIGGEVRGYDPTTVIDRKEARRMGRFSLLAVGAASEAVGNSGLNLDAEDRHRVGVLLGTGAGGLVETDQQSRIMVSRGGMRMSPFYMVTMLPNMAAANVSRLFGVTGYNNTCITACAAGTHAIGDAAHVIRRGDADVMIAGGAEASICELGLGAFCTIQALTTRNDVPEKASRPFDADRDGFAPAEGSGILILESLEHALTRGANILAEVVGYGVTADAFHLVQPHAEGEGAANAILGALASAGMTAGDIEYINAHGTSTPLNDISETKAIKRALGDRAYEIPISSSKSMIGHGLGAAGALEAIATIKTIVDGVIHPTINHETPDPECDLDYVPNTAREADVTTALSNSFGFGGQNGCLIFRKFEE